MNPNDIILEDLSKSFEYAKACAELDKIDNIENIRDVAKSYIKLYLKQQEVVSNLIKLNS
jgi:hypothetical protein